MRFWYLPKLTWQAWLLLPLSAIVWFISTIKRFRRSKTSYPVPIVVVGNLTVGGTGKTPMIIWLAELCKRNGMKVGVVSRGYGANSNSTFPLIVGIDSTADHCGDEPKLIQKKLNIPVVVDPNRDQAVRYLLDNFSVDLIISDDGLQHYGMYRDIEILMLDGGRALGNGLLLPAGPLRESAKRISSVDYIVCKNQPSGHDWTEEVARLELCNPINSQNECLKEKAVKICSGIGNFDSFRESVLSLGYEIIQSKKFSDHQKIPLEDLSFDGLPIIITEKDAIKLNLVDSLHVFVLPIKFNIRAEFEKTLVDRFRGQIDEKSRHYSSKV